LKVTSQSSRSRDYVSLKLKAAEISSAVVTVNVALLTAKTCICKIFLAKKSLTDWQNDAENVRQ